MTINKKRLLLFLVPLFLALPFLNRAYFVDDHFFVEIAHWIKDNPLRPYSFPTEGQAPDATLTGKELSMRIVNPLLHQYFMAGLMKLGGDREWFLRLGGVLFSCFSALLLFELARRWMDHPFLATIFLLVTPAFWVTSFSLLIDPTLLFFFLMGLYAFIRAGVEDSIPWMLLSGVALGLALLTKYTALLALPVCWTWLIINRSTIRRPWLLLLSSVMALLILSLYVGATRWVYGAGHLFAASSETLTRISFAKILVLMVFLSGGTVVPLLIWGMGPSRVILGGVLLMVLSVSVFGSSLGGFSIAQALLMGLSCVTSFLLLMLFLIQYRSWRPKTDAFLLLWLLGFLGMMVFVMPWVAVRYLLIGLPPLVFCTVRLVEISRPRAVVPILWGGILLTGMVGAAVGYADYQQAESSRRVVSDLRRANLLQGDRNYYFADAFTMTYLLKEDWKPISDPSKLSPGDRVITSQVTFPLFWFFRHRVPIRLVGTFENPTSFPLKVMDSKGGAGFYGSAWGPLPFSFSSGPWERFHLFEIIESS
ncbi:MAG: hypothetical protein KCHDKBKB_01984 [Elusimicrobia bacterium]|nr:hypothetical protein [Elusimicrobiota bacterium]